MCVVSRLRDGVKRLTKKEMLNECKWYNNGESEWFGNVQRMNEERFIKMMHMVEVRESRRRGKPQWR